MKIFCFIIISFLLFSCGADKLKINNTSSISSSVSSSSSTKSCMCTSDFAPVCGDVDKKDYDNACLAKCLGNDQSSSKGHCSCDNARIVCGFDGKEYGECDANKAKIEIVKYSNCSAIPI